MKKKLFTLLLFIFPLFSLHAIPGVKSYIQDNSGEYVYYRDTSFSRESYVGILYYDEATYQIKYYAPADEENFLPPKEIAILMTINPEAEHWEMTGEKIISTILPNSEDTDIVNYLHDIMYDFSSKRNHAEPTFQIEPKLKEFSINSDYPQFGGKVTINFDSLIPIFNIFDIFNSDSERVFYCVTFGQLRDSLDSSFDNFHGIPESPVIKMDKKKNNKAKKAKTSKTSFLNHEFKLDNNWTQSMDNMWLYGDDAILTIATIPTYSDDLQLNKTYITRKLLESTDGNYTDYTKTSFIYEDEISDNYFKIYSETYQPDSNQKIISYKIFTLSQNNTYDLFNLTMYQKPYEELKDYFLNIIKSYNHK